MGDTMETVTIRVYYDFASTLCYVAHRVMCRIEEEIGELGVELEWRPIDLTMAAVDFGDLGRELQLQFLIGIYMNARGYGDLQERNRALERRTSLQQVVECLEAIGQSLGIVDTVHPDRQPRTL